MFHHSLHHPISRRTALHWCLGSFLAGSVNTGGYIACARFVSHITGFATLFGVEVAHGRWDGAIGILTVPLYFLLGVMISAYLVDRPHHLGRRPQYGTAFGLVAACLVAAALLGHFGCFSAFDGALKLKHDYFLLVLLCGASGLQNAAITTASGATVRTTHLTGVTTDLGIGIIRAMTLKPSRRQYAFEERLAKLRVGTIGSFTLGSVIGAVLFIRVGYLGFLMPAAIAAYIMAVAISERHLPYTPRSPDADPAA